MFLEFFRLLNIIVFFADRFPDEESAKTVTPLGEAPPGGPQALLRAAREADDEDLRKIVMRVEKFGLGDIDVNSTDSSGRVSKNIKSKLLSQFEFV